MSGLEKEFPGRVTARNVDASTPEARRAVQALGFKTHGLVIRGQDGTALWKQPDHTVRMESVEKALREIVGS